MTYAKKMGFQLSSYHILLLKIRNIFFAHVTRSNCRKRCYFKTFCSCSYTPHIYTRLSTWYSKSQQLDGFAISSWAFYEEHCQVALVVEIITKKLQIVASNQLHALVYSKLLLATHKAANTCPHWPRGGR